MRLQVCLYESLCDDEKRTLSYYYRHYTKKYETDSGLDIMTPRDYVVAPHQTLDIHLGICCAPIDDQPHGYYLYPRSSISRTKLRLANSVGIIDNTYRGELIAMVDNIGDVPETIKAGTKLFQICAPDLRPFNIELVDSLTTTDRGSGGFGSTNKQ